MRLALTVVLIATLYLQGQTPDVPRFEAASLKLVEGQPAGWSTTGRVGQRGFVHIPLNDCLKIAFGLQDYSLIGPPWLNSVRLDIVAKPPANTPPEQSNKMLQTLLIERFKIESHWEKRTVDGYSLVPFKNGMPKSLFDKRETNRAGQLGSSDVNLWGYGVTTAQLSEMLAANLRQPVENHTGVTDLFDFTLQWKPLDAQASTTDDPGQSIFTALKEQLGLMLTKTKLPVDVLVIDKLNRTPEEN